MAKYLYSLIRYVPNPERMEPMNVGLILQGEGRVAVGFSPHAAKRDDVNTDTYRTWKNFFMREINGEGAPLFRPPKDSAAFLDYLAKLTTGPNVLMSRALSAALRGGFDAAFENLFRRLVLPLDEPTTDEVIARPTGMFRRLEDERDFIERGMRRHVHLTIGETRLWMPYRQVDNGDLLALDKVEASRSLGATATEIERLSRVTAKLPDFLRGRPGQKHTRYVLLADELEKPFADQTPREFDLLRADLDEQIKAIRLMGGTILRSPDEAKRLADEIDLKLPAKK